MVEALSRGEELRQVPEMPLADHHRLIATGFGHLGQRHLVGMQADAVGREEHTGHADARAVAAGQEAGPRHRADRRRVEAREAHAFRGEPIQVGRAQGLVAEGADVRVAHVVDEEDDDVRGSGRFCGERREAGEEEGEQGTHREAGGSAARAYFLVVMRVGGRNSSAVQPLVRPASRARVSWTNLGSTGAAVCSHSRRT